MSAVLQVLAATAAIAAIILLRLWSDRAVQRQRGGCGPAGGECPKHGGGCGGRH